MSEKRNSDQPSDGDHKHPAGPSGHASNSGRPRTPPPSYSAEPPQESQPTSSGPLTLTFSHPIIHPPPPSAALYMVPTSLTSKGIPLRLQRLVSVPNSPKQHERDLYESVHVPTIDYYSIRGLRSGCIVSEGELHFSMASSKFDIKIETTKHSKKMDRKVMSFDGAQFWFYPPKRDGKGPEKVLVGEIVSAGEDKMGELQIVEGTEEKVRDLVVMGWAVGIWRNGEGERRKMDRDRFGLLGKLWPSKWNVAMGTQNTLGWLG